MKVLVTGGNGMLATHTIKLLIQKNYEVRAMLRDTKKFQLELHPKVELVQGDITDLKATKSAVEGCDYVIHAAAITSPNLLTYDPYHRVNVTGTINLMKAAVKHGIKRVVYVSSANTIGYGDTENPGKEEYPVKEPYTHSLYAKSKLEGEQEALSFSDKLDVVVVNPTFMIGAYDAKPGSGRIVLMGYNKSVAFYPPGGKNFVNAKDAANGVVAALEKGINRRKYLLAGENLSYNRFFQKLKNKSPKNIRLLKIPGSMLLTLGYLAKVPRKMKIKTDLSPVNMKTLTIHNFYDNNRAKKELGVIFNPIDEGIDEAVSWFRENNML